VEFFNGFLLSLSLCLDIGIANVAMITLAMQRGYFQGFSLGVGTCIGDLIYAVLALFGMAALLQYESVRWTLWVGGSVILVYFTYKMLRSAVVESHSVEIEDTGASSSYLQDFSKGVFLAMSSPTAILWFAAVGGGRSHYFTIWRSRSPKCLSFPNRLLCGWYILGWCTLFRR